MGAHLFSPSHIVAIDLADSRLAAAKQFGADITVNNSRQDPAEVIRSLTDGLGAGVTIEAVGVSSTFELAVQLARPGGRIANITITTGLVDAYSTPTLLRLLAPDNRPLPDWNPAGRKTSGRPGPSYRVVRAKPRGPPNDSTYTLPAG
jgi:threonine dehydrogenase-like Zn-dependent dehydrogenase